LTEKKIFTQRTSIEPNSNEVDTYLDENTKNKTTGALLAIEQKKDSEEILPRPLLRNKTLTKRPTFD